MTARKTKTTGNRNPAKCLAYGAIIGLLTLLALLFALSAAVIDETLPETMQKLSALAACFVSAFIGSIISVKAKGGSPLPLGFGTGACLFVLLLVAGAVSGRGAPINGTTPLVMAVMLSGGIVGGLIASRCKKSRR